MPMVEVSNGELIDKLTILDIKMQRVNSVEKREEAAKEYDLLLPEARKIDIVPGTILYERLLSINMRLWDVEDAIRSRINDNDYGEEFIQLAKDIPMLNRNRFLAKATINEKTNSNIREVKEYAGEE